jgi:hypothetical protein
MLEQMFNFNKTKKKPNNALKKMESKRKKKDCEFAETRMKRKKTIVDRNC